MDYLAEIKKLPSEIQDILISSFGAEVNSQIIKKHNLPEDDVSKLINVINDLYLKILPLKDLVARLADLFKKDSSSVKELSLDIAGLKLMIANDYFGREVEKYISSQVEPIKLPQQQIRFLTLPLQKTNTNVH